jgi:hypothetical protein
MPPKANRSRSTKKIARQTEHKDKQEEAAQERKKPVRKKPAKSLDRRTLTPRFKAVFLAVFSITVLSLIGYVTLAVMAGVNSMDSSTLDGAIETLKTAFISGFGAILGLLGGKAL